MYTHTQTRTPPYSVLQHPPCQPHVAQRSVRRDDERPHIGGPGFVYTLYYLCGGCYM